MSTYHGRPFAASARIALVCARFNSLVVERLEQGARSELVRHGIDEASIDTVWVPGALEVPMAAKALAGLGTYDAIVGLGVVIRGSTYHFEVVSNQSASGLMRLGLDSGVVVTNGILTVDNMDQALDRAGGKVGNKGGEAALAAIETLDVIRQVTAARA
jgi:6,7-dimethyl-8-ribityllumazine synthase